MNFFLSLIAAIVTVFVGRLIVGILYSGYLAARVELVHRRDGREAYENASLEMLKIFIRGTFLFPDTFVIKILDRHGHEFDQDVKDVEKDPRYKELITLMARYRAKLVLNLNNLQKNKK